MPDAKTKRQSREINLTSNARVVLTKRYLRRGPDGKPVETVEGMFERISRAVAEPDAAYGTFDTTEQCFYDLLTSLRFFPNSPTFTGAGTPLGQLAACFTAAMRVTTDRGAKPIADLQVGDRVLTHEGRYRPVTKLFRRAYDGDLLRIKVKLIGTTLEVTPEHPILTPRGWVKSGELTVGDKVAVGVPQGVREAPCFDLAQSVYADELELQVVDDSVRARAAIRPVDTTYVTPNAHATAQITLPPLQSRALAHQAFGRDLPAPDSRYGRNSMLRQDETVYFEIDDITVEPYSGAVYNCEVDEDHSYVTEGIVVHNCFVLPITDDMGRDESGIFQTLRDAALIQQTGGGNGFSFSRLRPKGDYVATSAGTATGPVGFLRVYDKAFGEIAQGGCLLPETLVFTAKGLLRLDELVDPTRRGWHAHNHEMATDEGPRPSRQGYNNGVAPVLRVHTREGLSLAGTAEHCVKVMTDDGPAWRALRDLQPGDWLIVKLGEHRGEFHALRHPERQHGNQNWPTLPTVLDEELAFFLGYLAGDGFVAARADDHRVGVSVAHTSYLMDEMPRLLERLFGVVVHRQQKPNDRSLTFVIDNCAVNDFLLLNGLEKPRSQQVSVPRALRQSPPEIVGAYLRGLFEADGALSHGYPSLMTTSARLAEEVATLLIGLGCPVSLRSIAPGVHKLGEAVVYQLRIHSSVGLQAWRERIGCDTRSRFVAAYAWQSDERRESVYPLPCPKYWVEPVLDAVTRKQVDRQGRGMNLKFRSDEPRLRRTLLRYLRGDRQLTRSGYDTLTQAYPAFAEHARAPHGLWFVQVNGVEAEGEALTLDLEVDDNHTYLAYGVVTHNSRRGANMGVLRVDHPDIMEFITSKSEEGSISNFNISVAITDKFMDAVKHDADFELVNPRDGRVMKTMKARQIFDAIVTYAHHNGEPGCLFIDAANRTNPVPHLYDLESTNPCGEQWLGPYENCCLGSINLAQHILTEGDERRVDWEKLQRTVEEATHFLDDVVSANKYVPSVPQLREAALRARRIGLGIMGLGDLMFALGVRYGSRAGEDFAGQVMEFVRYHCMKKSIELAEQRGPFTAIEGSIYDPSHLKWQPPTPLQPYSHDWNRPAVDWDSIVEGIKSHGIRNAAQTTIAPTGTIATVAGCEGYGCEPVFALAYVRHVKDPNGGPDIDLTYASPQFERALIEAGLDEKTRQKVYDRVLHTGTCQDVSEIPAYVRDTFVVAGDITPEEHVRMQAAMQRFVDNSLSKTTNLPEGSTVEDVARIYSLAWELGCKGLTVYVTGSRDQVVLETKATLEAKRGQTTLPVVIPQPRERQSVLSGRTYRMETPIGTAYVTINDVDGQPYEVFINVGKGGSDVAAVSEALGRLCSLELQTPSPLSARERAKEIVHKLRGISGSQAIGFGPNRVASLPDAIAVALNRHVGAEPEEAQQLSFTTDAPLSPSVYGGTPADTPALTVHRATFAGYTNGTGKSVHRDLCPECGQATLIHEEGCRHCSSCGFSKC